MGHMANTLHELKDLLAQGANSIEADVVFAPNGTAVKLNHEDGCDCDRNCNQETEIRRYLYFLKNAVSKGEKSKSSSVTLEFY
ncbi:hypothetical protein HPB48_013155 [Haemaphysalis longicornis]|uniref:Uncharacterized protein n=1 Tax=Haemaphysalis longicornis TaxID=44386 RepID=A0A9J6FNI7_HAELO|nr:hypothetical protein HPB48_013155 [Haemaphysalis longicornis]